MIYVTYTEGGDWYKLQPADYTDLLVDIDTLSANKYKAAIITGLRFDLSLSSRCGAHICPRLLEDQVIAHIKLTAKEGRP